MSGVIMQVLGAGAGIWGLLAFTADRETAGIATIAWGAGCTIGAVLGLLVS